MRRASPDRLSDDHLFHFVVLVVEAATIVFAIWRIA